MWFEMLVTFAKALSIILVALMSLTVLIAMIGSLIFGEFLLAFVFLLVTLFLAALLIPIEAFFGKLE